MENATERLAFDKVEYIRLPSTSRKMRIYQNADGERIYMDSLTCQRAAEPLARIRLLAEQWA